MQKKTKNQGLKVFSSIAMTSALVFTPVSMALNPGQSGMLIQQHKAEAAGLADIALLSNQNLDASYNGTTKELRLNIKGTVLLNVGALGEQHYTYQLPSEFREILELPNIKDAVKINYDQKLIAGLISVSKGTLSGNDISVDAANGIVTGSKFSALDLSVLSTMKAELIIDLGVLGYELPSSSTGQLKFYGTASKSPLVDLPLLSNEGASDVIATIFNADLTANVVTDQDTVVTGIKKNSTGGALGTGLTKIRVFKGETEIGSADVSSSANKAYSVNIPQQPAGTVLTIKIYTKPLIGGSFTETGTPLSLSVTDATAPDAPVVNPVTDADTVVTGTGEVGATVTVSSPTGETWTGVVDQQGNYAVTIPAQVAGTELAVDLTDAAGNVSESASVEVTEAPDNIAPEAPTVNDVTDSATEVTGSAEPGSTVDVVFPNGETAQGKADENGNFTVAIPEGVELEAGKDITVSATDEAGNISEETTVTIKETPDTTAPSAPTVNDVTDSATEVTGSAEPGSTVEVTFPNGETATGTTDENGNFTVTIPEGVELEAGKDITVSAKDEAGNISEETKVTIKETPDTTAPAAPTVDEVTDSATEVTGSAEPGSEVEVTFPNGETATGTIDENGSFTVTVPEGVELEAGKDITVSAKDKAGNISEETKVTIKETPDTTAPSAPSVDEVTDSAKEVTGSAEPGSTVEVTFPNGETATGTVDEEGNFAVTIPEGVELEAGKDITVSATDEAGNISEETTVTIKESPLTEAPVISDVFRNDDYITGIAQNEATLVRLWVNGVAQRTAAVVDGEFSIYSRYYVDANGERHRLTPGDTVRVDYGFKGLKDVFAETTVQEKIYANPTINSVKALDETVSGIADSNATIVRLFVNGVAQRTAAVVDGEFSIYSSYYVDANGERHRLTPGDTVRVDYGFKGPKDVFAETTVEGKLYANPTINSVKALDETVSGIADSNATIVRLFVNGVAQRTAAVVDGEFSIYSSYYLDANGERHRLTTGDTVRVDYGFKGPKDVFAETTVQE